MINFILGEAGSGKSSLVIEKIKGYAEAGKKIFVIVPEQFSFEYERKMYFSLGSSVSNSINVLSFTRLAGLIFDTFGNRSGEYADDSTKTALMYLAMKEIQKNKALQYFTRQSESRAFINDALAIVADLRRAAVSPEAFASRIASADDRIREKAMDISMIYSAWDRILEERGYRDGLTDITEASALANMNDFFEDTVCFIDEFDSFSPDETEMIDTIASECSELYVALCTPETENRDYSLFSTVNKTLAKLKNTAEKYSLEYTTEICGKPLRFANPAVQKLSRSIFRRKSAPVSSEGFVKITEAKDLYEEADFVCSYIRKLVNEENYSFGEISIASRQPEDYDMILKSALERYEIPYFSDAENSVMHTSVVILITSLLELIGARKFESDTLFRYAKTFLTPLSAEETAALENFCYKWNVDGKMWLESFLTTGLAGSENENELKYIEGLREKLINPLTELRSRCAGASASQMCLYIYEFLEVQKIKDRTAVLIGEYQKKNLTGAASELNRLWSSVMDIFSTVSDVLGGEAVSPDVFAELFTLIVRQNRFLSSPQSLDAVSVLSARKARLSGQRAVFVMGASEGILPYAAKQSGLLSDTDREAFDGIGIDMGKDTKRLLADERFIVYRLFSSASERVMISYPLSDAQGGTRFPSYILPQISAMYTDEKEIKGSASDYDIVFYSSTPASAYHNYVQHISEKSGKTASLRAALLENPEYRDRIEYLDALSPDSEHSVSDLELMRKLMSAELQVSATSFEEYTLCHFKYFCHHGLRIRARDRKELNMMELGSIVHSCLENIFAGCSSREEFLNLPDETIISKIKEFSEKYRQENLGGNFGTNERLDAKFEKFTEDTLYLVNHLKKELSSSKFTPEKFEFEICPANGAQPLRIKTANGAELVLRGKIDRVDTWTDPDSGEKFIRIIDYKTGVKKFSLENIMFGVDMQMLLYLFSITGPAGPFGESVPAGVLYMPSGSIAVSRDRDDEKSTEKYLDDFYHMSGVVLKELKVLRAMEEEIAGVYIPAAMKKGGADVASLTAASSVLTRPQFERLRKHTYSLLEKMAEDLYGGDISALPLNYNENRNVCSYCDYREICGNYPRRRERTVPDSAAAVMAEIMGDSEKKEDENNGMD